MKKETALIVIVVLMVGILLSDNRIAQFIMLILEWWIFYLFITSKPSKDETKNCLYSRATANFTEVKNLKGERKLESIMFSLGDKTYKITAEELNKYEEKDN